MYIRRGCLVGAVLLAASLMMLSACNAPGKAARATDDSSSGSARATPTMARESSETDRTAVAASAYQARVSIAHSVITAALPKAVEQYRQDVGAYPQQLADLLTRPAAAAGWQGPYSRAGFFNDPWGNPYTYTVPGQHNADKFDLASAGPDGRFGTKDDVVNWAAGG